jgi:hypothetical protein
MATKPTAAPTPPDPAEVLSEIVSEGKQAMRTVAFDGEAYTLPANVDEWDGDIIVALHAGDLYRAVELMVGSEQLAKFRAKKRTIGDWNSFAEILSGGNF